jgi:hypothetical protein
MLQHQQQPWQAALLDTLAELAAAWHTAAAADLAPCCLLVLLPLLLLLLLPRLLQAPDLR